MTTVHEWDHECTNGRSRVRVFVLNSWMVLQALIFEAVMGKIDVREEIVHE